MKVSRNGWRIMVVAAVILLMATAYIQTQRVYFSDPRLEALIREVSGRDRGQIYNWHVFRIEVLDALGRNISDLKGIESLSRLRWLNLEDNRIHDVTPLASLRKLNYLSLRNNGILNLDDIRFFTIVDLPLQGLCLRHNVVRYADESQSRLMDVSLLSHFEDLTFLDLRDNDIADFAAVSNLEKLVELDVSQNPVQGGRLDFIVGLNQLEILNLRETGLESIQEVASLTRLRYLNIHSNPNLESVSPLTGLSNLEELIMRDVPVGSQMTIFSGMGKLARLNLRNCGVQDLTVLGQLMAAGAFQEQPGEGMTTLLDLRDNPIPTISGEGQDGYAPVRPYWTFILERYPDILPD